MCRVSKQVGVCVLALVAVGLLSSLGCKKGAHRIPIIDLDALVSAPQPPEVRPPPPGLSRSFVRLLERRPKGARVFVALAQPERWLSALGRLVPWLSELPELSPHIQRWRRSLSHWLGGWPPEAAAWAQAGLDPEGGVALALVDGPDGARSQWWFAALASEPARLLGRVSGRPTSEVASALKKEAKVVAELPGALALHCTVEGSCVQCSTSPELLRGGGAAGPWAGPKGDLLVTLRWPHWRLRASLSEQAGGLRMQAHLAGRAVEDLAALLASPVPLPQPPRGGLVAAFGRMEPSRLISALGWIPKSHAALVPLGGAPLPLESLASTATGSWWLTLGSWGLRLDVARQGGSLPLPEVTEVTLGEGNRLFARTGSAAFTLGSSPSALASGAPDFSGVSRARPVAGTGAAGTGAAGARPMASAALWLLVTDPLEWLPHQARVRVLAAIMGLGEEDRALVALTRALLATLGEVTLLARPHAQGLALELTQRPPWAGPDSLARLYREAWREKWRTGGFFAPDALARLRRQHPDSAAGRLAVGLRELRLPPVWREAYLRALLQALSWLRGPEVSCTLLASRLKECRDAFGRQIDPESWQRLEQLRLLGRGGELGEELVEQATGSAAVLVTRCDALSGRMESAGALQGCLALGECEPLVRCLVGVFSPPSPDPGRSSGSPR